MASRSTWSYLYWLPIRQFDQMLFAEAFSQGLAAGLAVSNAVAVAAYAVRSRRFRAALREMAGNCRIGYSLETSLTRTRVAVGGGLLAALRVGQDQGCLIEQLSAFARRCDPHSAHRLGVAVGRRDDVRHFAAALAGLLVDRRLTIELIQDAAEAAAGKKSRLAAAAERVCEEMSGGAGFDEALRREPRTFDPLFGALLSAADRHDRLRMVLLKLAE
jgi:type II secretory pathway component PulF